MKTEILRRQIFILLIPVFIMGCFTSHKRFNLFFENKTDSLSIKLKIKGIYYLANEPIDRCIPTAYIFLFNNGMAYIRNTGQNNRFWVKNEFGFDKDKPWLTRPLDKPFIYKIDSVFWQNPDSILVNTIKSTFKFSPFNKEWWGTYSIKNNTIKIEYFSKTNQESIIHNRYLIELSGYLKNDSTIIITNRICDKWYHCYQCKSDLKNNLNSYTPPVQYNFYSTDFKPDSTQAWFLKKHWYKKGLHQSRK